MPASFGNFFSKRKHHNPRSQDPTGRRRRHPERSAGEGSQFGCQAPALLSITAKPGQFNDRSAAGEIDRLAESPPVLESPVLTKTPPGLHGTQRFFVSVGQSNSLLEEASMAKWPSDSHLTRTEIIPVPKYSTDPRNEFRRSMEEMVRWRLQQNLGEIDSLAESPPGLESPVLTKTPPGLHGTQRFFVSVGQSNSLLEEASTAKWPSYSHLTRTEIIPVPKYSTDPRNEFRRSMEEMVRWRLQQNLAVDWDYLVELFMCYVQLNEKEARKYILKAFVDLLVPLRQSHSDTPATLRRNSVNGIRR